MSGPPVLQPLRRAAFLTFRLSRYVFIGPPADSISPSVCILDILLAEGRRLPLAPLYLGSLYACLDQAQEHMRISFGRFSVNYYADEVSTSCLSTSQLLVPPELHRL